MFTIEEIKAAEEKVLSAADFPDFALELKKLGVKRSDVYVMNGMSIYFGEEDYTVESAPVYESLLISEEANAEEFKAALEAHQRGEADYITFCRQAAGAGVEKWIIDLQQMNVTYLDTTGQELLVESI